MGLLPEADLPVAGALQDQVVRARGEDAMVFVTGVGGAVPRETDPVAWGPARQVPWWVVFPTSAGVAGVEVPELARTIGPAAAPMQGAVVNTIRYIAAGGMLDGTGGG